MEEKMIMTLSPINNIEDKKVVVYLEKEDKNILLNININISVFNVPKKINGSLSLTIHNETLDKTYIIFKTRLEKQKTRKTSEGKNFLSLTFSSKFFNFENGLYKIEGAILNNNQDILANAKTYLSIG